jgi:glycosyltransferase involved in cell wall biosynthesis
MEFMNLKNSIQSEKIRVAMVQKVFAHYRRAIFRALATHPLLDFTLLRGAEDGPGGMKNIENDPIVKCLVGPTMALPFKERSIYIMPHIVDYARYGDYDVMIFPNEIYCLSLWPLLRVIRKRGKRAVIFSIGFPQYKQWLRDKIRVWWARKVDSMVLYSFAHRERYIKCGVPAEKIFVAPNAVDVDAIKAAEANMTAEKLAEFKKRHNLTDSLNIIHAGRMVDFKQLELLLKAAVKLVKVFDNLKFILIGEGPMLKQWQQLGHELGIADNIIWPGAIYEQNELCYWFHSSHLCVAPGQQGLIANLSHSYGVPLITSDSPRWQGPEIQVFTNGKTGLLYRYADIDDLAAKIEELLNNPARRKKMGEEARRTIFEDFTVERMCQGFIDGIQYAMKV